MREPEEKRSNNEKKYKLSLELCSVIHNISKPKVQPYEQSVQCGP
jgi:hypothetical protein